MSVIHTIRHIAQVLDFLPDKYQCCGSITAKRLPKGVNHTDKTDLGFAKSSRFNPTRASASKGRFPDQGITADLFLGLLPLLLLHLLSVGRLLLCRLLAVSSLLLIDVSWHGRSLRALLLGGFVRLWK